MEAGSQMLKGNTPTLVLAVLGEGPSHGYAIVQEITRRGGEALKMKQATLYPTLQALERDGLIEGDWVTENLDRPRRVYQITEKGREELQNRLRSWKAFAGAVDRVIAGMADVEPA